MTEGRFESSVHTGPHPREGNPHWASFSRDPSCPFRKWDAETRQKESCPFHDLRAEGQFQPEIHCIGDGHAAPDPNFFLRKDGPRMKCSMHTGPHVGAGGQPLPFDTTPKPPAPRPKADKPWASTSKGGTFSKHMYEPLGPPVKVTNAASKGPHFHSGKVPEKPSSYEHMVDSRIPEKPKKPSRLLSGKGSGLFDANIHKGDRMVIPPEEKPKSKAAFPPPIVLRKNIENTFGKYPPYMPHTKPDDRGRIKKSLKPIYTWHTQTKRSMPISAPWTVTRVSGS